MSVRLIYLLEASVDEDGDEVQAYEYIFACRRSFKAWSSQADIGFPLVVGAVVCDLAPEPAGLSRRAGPSAAGAGTAIRTTDSRAVTAVGRADCAVSRFARGADSGSGHVSRASRGGRQMGRSAS